MVIWSDIRRRAILVVALAASPACFVLGILRPRSFSDASIPSHDFYAYFYPNVLHALRSLEQGFGLFWNPYQNCGQPFFAFSLTALLHPPNIVFFLFDRETAHILSMLLNLTIGGGGVWLLLRELRMTGAAALAGAISFEVSATALYLAAWSPMHIGPYVWMPWALFAVERILREPTYRSGIVLAAVLAIQLLPGFPLTSLFTVQLVALRVAAALLTREVERPARLLIPLVIGLAAAPLLVAVQYVPSLQVASESVRASGVGDTDILRAASWVSRPGLVMAMLAAASLIGRRHRATRWFYLVAGAIFLLLSLGDLTPLFDVYRALPLGDLFVRRPGRFLWVTSFALSVLVGIGVDEITRNPRAVRRLRRATLPIAMLAVAILMYRIPTWVPESWEWATGALALTLTLWGSGRRPGHMAAPWVLGLVLAASGLYAQREPLLNLHAGPYYDRYEHVFDSLRTRITPQDRVLIDVKPADMPLIQKTASIFGVRSITDYEPQTTGRFAEFMVRLNLARPMLSLNDYLYYPNLRRGYSRPLLDLAATRYFVAPDRERRKDLGPHWKEILHESEVTIYQNLQARPRAAYVPVARVIPRDRILETLSRVAHRPERVTLIETPPASGFLGSPGGEGSVEFLEDRGERVVLRVRAPKPGFVTLADQYFPGWIARVNGEPAEILRANYVFRAVEVPAGESEIVFEYRLTRIAIGAVISLLTLTALTWLWWREARAATAPPSD